MILLIFSATLWYVSKPKTFPQFHNVKEWIFECKSKGLQLLHLNIKTMNRELLIVDDAIMFVSESELGESVIQSGILFDNYVLRCDRNWQGWGVVLSAT